MAESDEQIASKTHTGSHSTPATPTKIWGPVLAHCHCHQRPRWLPSPQRNHLCLLFPTDETTWRDVKSHYADNSRCMPDRWSVNENTAKFCSKWVCICLCVTEPYRYQACKPITIWLAASPAFQGDTGHDIEIPTHYCFPILAPNELALEEFSCMSIIWYIMSTSERHKVKQEKSVSHKF